MEKAILYKLLHRKLKFRNPQCLTELPSNITYSSQEYHDAREYILQLIQNKIKFTYPHHPDYPDSFLQMKEPPLFMEYIGEPIWKKYLFISIVGAREIDQLSEAWLKSHLPIFLYKNTHVGVVSGGALGVDQLAHLIAIKNNSPTIFVLPSGLFNLYPKNLINFKPLGLSKNICFVTEFELHQRIHKSHFYFRNRIISALGKCTLVVQATKKSGSMLTVHHGLEQGRPILCIPSHPELVKFDGNLKLLSEGAFLVRDNIDLHDFWKAEFWYNTDLFSQP